MRNYYQHFQLYFVSHNPLIQWMIIFFLIFTSEIFRYKGWDPTLGRRCSYLVFLLIALYTLWQRKCLPSAGMSFKHEVIVLTLLPLLCLITKTLVNGEPWYEERIHILHPPLFPYIFHLFYIRNERKRHIACFYNTRVSNICHSDSSNHNAGMGCIWH